MFENKAVVVYFSYTNNTKLIAGYIRERTGAALIPIEMVTPYPLEYHLTIDQMAEQNKTGLFTPIRTKIENVQDYKALLLGFPIWDMRLPPPVRTFLRDNDLSGKYVIPFNTHSGFGSGKSMQEIRRYCPHSKVLKEFSENANNVKTARANVNQWLDDIE